MTVAVKSQRALAVALALLTLAPAVPVVAAEHTAELPRLPILPHAEPGEECVELPSLQAELLAALNELQQGDTSRFALTDQEVPALCDTNNMPITAFTEFVRQADITLGQLRNVTALAQSQLDLRLEHTLPGGSRRECEAGEVDVYPDAGLTTPGAEAPRLACDVLTPQFTIMDERFDGRRVGGFGEWQVFDAEGAESLFYKREFADFNGTRSVMRFGTDQGYERGVHQFLVSPEIDLAPVAATAQTVQLMRDAREEARGALYAYCNELGFDGRSDAYLYQFCGEGGILLGSGFGSVPPNLAFLVRAYEATFDEVLRNMPAMRVGAQLEFKYRINMADGIDGVRAWLFVGDEPPTSAQLFGTEPGPLDDAKGTNGETFACVGSSANGLGLENSLGAITSCQTESSAAHSATVTTTHGSWVYDGDETSPTMAFMDASVVKRTDMSNALTGDNAPFETVRINLTEFVPKRVWLMFEVATQADRRGTPFFTEPDYFPRNGDFGFELADVRAVGDGFHRNVRVKDIASDRDHMPAINQHDDPYAVRSILPPGNDPILIRIQNAGQYRENVTLNLLVENNTGGDVDYDAWVPVGRYATVLRNVTPSEVREVEVPWTRLLKTTSAEQAFPEGVPTGRLYRVSAAIDLDSGEIPGVGFPGLRLNTTYVADPNNTAVRTPNVAQLPTESASAIGLSPENRANASVVLRAFTAHNLTALAPRGETNPLLVCAKYEAGVCEKAFSGKRGDERVAVLRVRNDGSGSEDGRVVLHVTRDGVVVPSVIDGEATKSLQRIAPGESRVVTWNLVPTEVGVYRLRAVLELDDVPPEQRPYVERLLYVGRTTGTICFDDLEASRACAPSFATQYSDSLGRATATASAVDGAGVVYVATEVTNTTGGLYQRRADGSWIMLVNLSRVALNEELGERADGGVYGNATDITFGPDGSIYLVGESGLILRRSAEGDLSRIRMWSPARLTNLTVAEWFNGTLWVGGEDGYVHYLNGSRMNAANLTYGTTGRFNWTFHDALVANGSLYFAGDRGFVYRFRGMDLAHPNTTELNVSRNWTALYSDDNPNTGAVYEKGIVRERDIHALTLDGGQIWAAGEDGLLLNASKSSFHFASVPVFSHGADFVDVFPSHEGGLLAFDAEGRFTACADCSDPRNASWTYPEVPIPLAIEATGEPRPARLLRAVAGPGFTLVLGEGGLILDYARRSIYDNVGDWETLPRLVSTDGVFQTIKDSSQANSWMGTVSNPTPPLNQITEFRVTVKHHILRASPSAPAVIRLYALNYTNYNLQSAPPLCPHDDPSAPNTLTTACKNAMIGEPVVFSAPTPTDGWVTTTYTVTRSPSAGFYGIEFLKMGAVQWTVDEAVVEGRLGNQYVELVHFRHATNDAFNVGDWGFRGFVSANLNVPVQWYRSLVPFEYEPVSGWHVTQRLTDRPVWVVNDELVDSGEPGDTPGGATPHLRSGWNTRLLTPIIDLASSYDPVISFRHAFAFRTQTFRDANDGGALNAGDLGLVEIQYELSAAECAKLVPARAAPCGWSPFYKLVPKGGYPSTVDILGPAGEKFTAATVGPAEAGLYGPATGNAKADGGAFWGRNVEVNERGIVEEPRYVDSDAYEEVRIVLDEQRCVGTQQQGVECGYLPTDVNLSGRKVRVAFHFAAHTGGIDPSTGKLNPDAWDHTHPDQTGMKRSSYAGEGWYIADFKVLGAKQLGLNLNVTNATFRVGYDVANIGVGPGTDVAVNVTVNNGGAYDVLGYTGVLEVRRVIDPVAKLTVPEQRFTLTQQALLQPGERRNHTFTWRVPPVEDANYTLVFTAKPIGIDSDEDPTDNVGRIGTITKPVLAKTHRAFNIEPVVTPENATSDITRYVPIFINNTGNVPIADVKVDRDIRLLRGIAIVAETKSWNTTRPVPAGTRVPLAAYSEEVNPSADLFWKPSERATYLFAVSATAGELRSTSQRLVAAFATYLFDDVDAGPRGEATRGEWNFSTLDGGWVSGSPGFLTQYAYSFGDAEREQYPADANAAAITPTIDLSNARSARLSFYHRYQLEERFDGGVVEASADGGKTWEILTPLPDKLNELPYGYNRTLPLTASSALHPTGDPDVPVYGVTGDSCSLPAAIDCWVLSEFDLTGFAPIREKDVVYLAHGSVALAKVRGLPVQRLGELGQSRVYSAESWAIGTQENQQWFVENLSELDVRSPVDNGTFWWSGSANLTDDGTAPSRTQLLSIPINLTGIPADTTRTILIDWWEWADRYDQASHYLTCGGQSRARCDDMRGAYSFHGHASAPSQAYRLNVTAPDIVERRGDWYHLQADVTDWAGDFVELGFVYSPFESKYTYPPITTLDEAAINGTGTVIPRYEADRGFAVDAFTVRSAEIANGKVTAETILLNESAAWESSSLEVCAAWNTRISPSIESHLLPCYYQTGDSTPGNEGSTVLLPLLHSYGNTSRHEIPLAEREVGKWWKPTDALPRLNASWRVIPVTLAGNQTRLPGGETAFAWYSGDTACKRKIPGTDVLDCLGPGSESRLVSPAFDLSKVAGQNAALSFDHRYAFPLELTQYMKYPKASGGVVEVQTWDPDTRTWSPWTQLVNGVPTIDGPVQDGVPVPSERAAVVKPGQEGVRGGYSSYTVNRTPSTSGYTRIVESPFQPFYDPVRKQDFQYLFSGHSWYNQAGNKEVVCPDGWCESRFDLTRYIGTTVRFGFHVHMTGMAPSTLSTDWDNVVDWPQGTDHLLPVPEKPTEGASATNRGGWWITNIAVIGDVMKAAPIQLRLHAATDGNVDEGYWQLDDIGVYGSRYAKNLGIFVDEAPGAFGALNRRNGTIPVTIRNLGESIERGLVLEVLQVGKTATTPLQFGGTAPGGIVRFTTEGTNNPGVRYVGYTVAPGQSVTVDVEVRAPAVGVTTEVPILMRLRTAPDQAVAGEVVSIADNEVEGFLTRELSFRIEPAARIAFPQTRATPAVGEVGEPVTLGVEAFNTRYGDVKFNLTCTATLVREWAELDHTKPRTQLDSPTSSAGVPCDLVTNVSTLGPSERQNFSWSATPTGAGYLRFEIKGNVVDNISDLPIAPIVFSVPVGVPAVVLKENFTSPIRMHETWKSPYGLVWSAQRGRLEPGALVIGYNESLDTADGTGGSPAYNSACPSPVAPGNCTVISPTVDLHNFSQESLFLSFWHMERFAYGDGGDVYAQVLVNEERPAAANSWSDLCRLEPEGGYEGPVWSYVGVGGDGAAGTSDDINDRNPDHIIASGESTSSKRYFVNGDGRGLTGRWEEEWSLAQIDLSRFACTFGNGPTARQVPILGSTVRFAFNAYLSADTADSARSRGEGHGWLLDDITIGPARLEVRPDLQTTRLLDNTSKTFNVVVRNHGDYEDRVLVEYDVDNSSTPLDSVAGPAEPIVIGPGERKFVPVTITLPRDPSLLPTQFRARVSVESLLDANVVDTSAFDIAFAPRQWPELSVKAAVPHEPAQEGTEVTIPVVIENTGVVPSKTTGLRVIDTFNGVSTLVTPADLDVPSMQSYLTDARDYAEELAVQWRPAKGTVGMHTLTFIVDPDTKSEEYTRENNVLVLEIPVVPLLIPDVDIGAEDALTLRNGASGLVGSQRDGDVLRYDVLAGDLVTFELNVKNAGRAGATDVDIIAAIGSLTLPAKNIPYIAPGSEVNVKFNWLAQKGEYDLQFTARSEQVELTTENNDYPGAGVVRLTVKGYEVEVGLPEVPGIRELGEAFEVPYTLKNAGNAGEEVRLVARADGIVLALDRSELFLREGEVIEGLMTVRIPAQTVAGEHIITVEAVSRENPMKVASASAPVRVRAVYGGAVVTEAATVAPPTFALPVKLVNTGNSLEPWLVTLDLPAGWTTTAAMPMSVGVPAYGETVHVVTISAPEGTLPGGQLVNVSVELPNGAKKTDTMQVDVREVRAAALRVASASPRAVDGALAYPVLVENVGNTRAPFELLLLDAPAGVRVTVEPSQFELAPGARTVATMLVTPDARATDALVSFRGFARFDGIQPDTAEGRANMHLLDVNLQRPDLRVGAVDLSPRIGLEPGDRVQVKTQVENRGATAVTDVPVHLYVDDVFVAETLLTLAPGERRDVAVNWTALPGEHTLTLQIDPYKQAAEADRADNAVSSLAQVAGPGIAGGIAAGSPVPGPGFLGTLIALAAALAVAGLLGARNRRNLK